MIYRTLTLAVAVLATALVLRTAVPLVETAQAGQRYTPVYTCVPSKLGTWKYHVVCTLDLSRGQPPAAVLYKFSFTLNGKGPLTEAYAGKSELGGCRRVVVNGVQLASCPEAPV